MRPTLPTGLEVVLRRRVRQESVSDLIVASLLRVSGTNLSPQVPLSDKVPGNNFDIIVYGPLTRSAGRIRNYTPVEAGLNLWTIERVSRRQTSSMVVRATHVDGVRIDNAMAALKSGGQR